MAEKYIVIEGEAVSFEGVFSLKDLLAAIKDWSDDKAYDLQEKKRTLSMKEEGKFGVIEFLDASPVSEYTKIAIKIKIELEKVKDTLVEVHKKKKKLQQGKVSVKFEGFIETDYEGRWEKKPLLMFVRSLFDKYIYKTITHSNEGKLRKDIDSLKRAVAKHFNVFKN